MSLICSLLILEALALPSAFVMIRQVIIYRGSAVFFSHPDPLLDDLPLYYITSNSLVVMCGCAHAGIMNIINQGFRVTGAKSLYGVIGGTHLRKVSDEQLRETFDTLSALQPRIIVAGHCTGHKMQARMWNNLPEDVFEFCHVGMVLDFP